MTNEMKNYDDWGIDEQLNWYDKVYTEIENLVGNLAVSFWEEKNKIQVCLNNGYSPKITAKIICGI